ncbi:aldo/keto reductase [Euzebyella marina]|uniref:Aldo/keto reductase n=1 Tax=Euzebyella marina TaxID=1761453 RepID=A0A3G2L9K5_9FLAO|nr:aldo/keto reductase [Euzebyella marina]AYN68948.1 aldo/keto reductase [Euzebyella marina]MAU71971.1 aldo/keto reductase [Pseudozobellia sp.]MBG48639.1 aldo/keto reductase [Pseudozobellia sp.]|tara:strand:+ start:640 stop:1611 length:972 start_codon:yes stop_codon:yes gene_type:complete
MKYRRFGRTDWQVSEIGYGMWGMAGWKESDDIQSSKSLDLAVENGVNFFDTAWGYGEGHSEELLGELVRRHPKEKLYTASKIPPKNFQWPAKPEYTYEESYPVNHIIEYTDKTLTNLGMERIDLMQFHTWDDGWSKREEWQRAIEDLKKQGKIGAMGISVNRWEPENGIEAIKTGLIDAVQVIYNIFDQNPEDRLFPLCEEMDIAVIARVPFDEGTLTGNLTKDTVFPEGDWRGTYFVPENLNSSVDHADALRPLIPEGMNMAEMALRFILENKNVSTTIPGMRKQRNVLANTATSDGKGLSKELLEELKQHRWDRTPTSWSQ